MRSGDLRGQRLRVCAWDGTVRLQETKAAQATGLATALGPASRRRVPPASSPVVPAVHDELAVEGPVVAVPMRVAQHDARHMELHSVLLPR